MYFGSARHPSISQLSPSWFPCYKFICGFIQRPTSCPYLRTFCNFNKKDQLNLNHPHPAIPIQTPISDSHTLPRLTKSPIVPSWNTRVPEYPSFVINHLFFCWRLQFFGYVWQVPGKEAAVDQIKRLHTQTWNVIPNVFNPNFPKSSLPLPMLN